MTWLEVALLVVVFALLRACYVATREIDAERKGKS